MSTATLGIALAKAVIDDLKEIEGHDGACHEEGLACSLCVLVEKAQEVLAQAKTEAVKS